MRAGSPPSLVRPFSQVSSSMQVSRSGAAPGRPGACIAPPPALTPRRLSVSGGFAVIDQRQRRLHDHARDQGFADLGSYLQARCQRHASPAQLASELGTTTTVVHHLLATAGITAPPRRVSAARKRRTTTDQQLAARAAELGFASLGEYLTDRAMTRRWPSTMIASELGVQPGTVRDRLDQHRLARLAELGFADVAAYLQLRRVQQGSSLRRMLAELQVGSAWLKGQMARLRIP